MSRFSGWEEASRRRTSSAGAEGAPLAPCRRSARRWPGAPCPAAKVPEGALRRTGAAASLASSSRRWRQARATMGAGLHLLPGDDDPGPVLAEDGVRRVGSVPLGVVAAGLDDGRPVPGRGVAAGDAAQPALAPGVGRQVPGVVPRSFETGAAAGEDAGAAPVLRGGELRRPSAGGPSWPGPGRGSGSSDVEVGTRAPAGRSPPA